MDWPKDITEWQADEVGFMSIPFTWNLRAAKDRVTQRDMFIKRWIVGGPAVRLMPEYLGGIGNVHVSLDDMLGVLQRVNPQATRTTTGCIRRCKFCGIGQRRIEGDFQELEDWPDLPIICDNNILASSLAHFHRVIDRLVKWEDVDFNQGLDARLLTPEHTERLAEIPKATVRLALDEDRMRGPWEKAFGLLREAGIARARIMTYVLIAATDGPKEGWGRCEFVEKRNHSTTLPQWFHSLESLTYNEVTQDQQALGWTEPQRLEIMGYYYKHRGKLPIYLTKRGD